MVEENLNNQLQFENLESNNEQDADLNKNIDSETSKDQLEKEALESTEAVIKDSLINLGFVNFDNTGMDNTTSGAMVSEDKRKHFRRDVYVLIQDKEQEKEFLGRIVEGPFHNPHEVGIDSAITRTTVLHPDRTRFRPSYYVSGTIEVLGELLNDTRLIVTPTRPRPYSEINIFPAERLRQLLEINGSFFLGHLIGYDNINVHTNAESKNFIPRNLGIFGTVGSGKSNTTQVLIEEAIKAGWAVVVVDVEGEYVKMNEKTNDAVLANILKERYNTEPDGITDFRVYVPQSGHTEAENSIRFKVPISVLDPFVLADLMELTEAQARLIEGIMENARNRGQTAGSRRGALDVNQTTNNTNRLFTLQTLIDGLQPGGDLVPQGIIDITINTLRSKLIRLGMSHILDWNATISTNELPVDDLLVKSRLSVLDVSETGDRSRNIAIAYTLQALFDRVIQTPVDENMTNGVPRPKVLVVMEEVHTFVSKSSASKMRAVLDNLQIISRRGRKRWMGLALVSQQPSHVPDELFELANTRFIHQLKSVSNLAPVKQTTGGVHEALWTNVPALGPGQCLVTGAIFKHPLFIEMRPAKSRRLHIG